MTVTPPRLEQRAAVARPRPDAHVAGAHPRGSVVLRLAPLLVLYLVVCAVAQPDHVLMADEPDLLAAAARLLDGHLVPAGDVVNPRSFLWHGPGLVALLAPLVALGLPVTVIRFADPILLAGAVLVFHRLLRVRLAPRAALTGTYALGLYVPFLAVVRAVHKEPLSILIVVVGMLALTRALGDGRWPWAVGAGLCIAALTMVRLEYGWVAVALLGAAAVAWAVRRHSRTAARLVVVGAVAVAGCVPWLAFTHHLTGQVPYWGTSSGLSLYWMSPTRPGETGQWHEPGDVPRVGELAAFRPFFARVARLDPVESDRVLRAHAVANIRARPLLYARNLVANTGRLFFSVPMRPHRAPLRIASNVLFNGLLLGALAWAAPVLWRRRRSLAPETAPIALFAAIAIAVHLPPSASPRMLLPVVPALSWIVAQALAMGRTSPPTR